MAYQMYLGDVLFPVAPSKVKMKINGKNKTLDLINGQEINVLNPPGLTEIDFDILLPAVQYPFADYEDGFEMPDFYLEELERMKLGKRPVRFIAIREFPSGDSFFDTNMSVSLEDYTVTEDAKEGMDVTVSVSLKQYVHYGVQQVTVQPKAAEPDTADVTVEEERETANAPELSSYTVRDRDCLWNIAKRYLGDGSRWPEIYGLNRDKVSNPNVIREGQVLAMPA
ncbi:MAG: LysM peptidoglycan-binding domain-containing protein [Lachnospiraceae bacterium]|nr:LysM peptidoglycan-binding domain-containing protein [Lachnospiraceae bacterium]